jgi:hypothetical protein
MVAGKAPTASGSASTEETAGAASRYFFSEIIGPQDCADRRCKTARTITCPYRQDLVFSKAEIKLQPYFDSLVCGISAVPAARHERKIE